MSLRLGLGTVQLGIPYGITNAAGRVPAAEAAAILARARDAGIDVLDTAALYGESEAVIGALLEGGNAFRIVTKTAKFQDAANAEVAVRRFDEVFAASLKSLRMPAVYGLIAHDADDLLGPYGDALWAAMTAHKAAGRVRRIGASVYTGAQIDALLARHPVELVQLPINALDDRLARGGQLKRLARRGVEVHARSLFLQGLLLQPPAAIPAKFIGLPDAVATLNAFYARHRLSPLEGSLVAILARPEISRCIVGVTSTRELEDIINAVGRASEAARHITVTPQNPIDERVLTPARWGEF